MQHGVLEGHLFVVQRGAEVLLRHEFVPLSLRMQVLVEEAEWGDIGVGKLTEFLLKVTLELWQFLGLARLEVAHDCVRRVHGSQICICTP